MRSPTVLSVSGLTFLDSPPGGAGGCVKQAEFSQLYTNPVSQRVASINAFNCPQFADNCAFAKRREGFLIGRSLKILECRIKTWKLKNDSAFLNR